MTPDIRADLDKQRGAIGGTAHPFSSSSSLTRGPSLRGAHTQGQNNGEKRRVETPEPTCLLCISLYNKPVSGHTLEPHKFGRVHVYSAVHTIQFKQETGFTYPADKCTHTKPVW